MELVKFAEERKMNINTEAHVTLLDVTNDAEKKIVRIAQLSRQQDFPENVTEEQIIEFFDVWINQHHHFSVLEHAYATFLIEGGSRSFTHQIVRHRIASYLQQSQRWIKLKNGHFIIPPDIAANNQAAAIYESYLNKVSAAYEELSKFVKAEDARFILPNAIESKIVITTNFREFRHIFELRGSLDAQWEIRAIAISMWEQLFKVAPRAFGCFKLQDTKGEHYLKIDSSIRDRS